MAVPAKHSFSRKRKVARWMVVGVLIYCLVCTYFRFLISLFWVVWVLVKRYTVEHSHRTFLNIVLWNHIGVTGLLESLSFETHWTLEPLPLEATGLWSHWALDHWALQPRPLPCTRSSHEYTDVTASCGDVGEHVKHTQKHTEIKFVIF